MLLSGPKENKNEEETTLSTKFKPIGYRSDLSAPQFSLFMLAGHKG